MRIKKINRIKRKNQNLRLRSKNNKSRSKSFTQKRLDGDIKDSISGYSHHIWPNQAMPEMSS